MTCNQNQKVSFTQFLLHKMCSMLISQKRIRNNAYVIEKGKIKYEPCTYFWINQNLVPRTNGTVVFRALTIQKQYFFCWHCHWICKRCEDNNSKHKISLKFLLLRNILTKINVFRNHSSHEQTFFDLVHMRRHI